MIAVALAWWLAVGAGLYGGPFDTLADCERAAKDVRDAAVKRGDVPPPATRCFQWDGPGPEYRQHQK